MILFGLIIHVSINKDFETESTDLHFCKKQKVLVVVFQVFFAINV